MAFTHHKVIAQSVSTFSEAAHFQWAPVSYSRVIIWRPSTEWLGDDMDTESDLQQKNLPSSNILAAIAVGNPTVLAMAEKPLMSP